MAETDRLRRSRRSLGDFHRQREELEALREGQKVRGEFGPSEQDTDWVFFWIWDRNELLRTEGASSGLFHCY